MGKYPRFWTSCSAELNISLRVSVDAVPESQCRRFDSCRSPYIWLHILQLLPEVFT